MHEMDIPKGLVISCNMASKKYKAVYAATSKETSNSEESRKQKFIQEEQKRSKSELEQSVLLLLKEKKRLAILANANTLGETV